MSGIVFVLALLSTAGSGTMVVWLSARHDDAFSSSSTRASSLCISRWPGTNDRASFKSFTADSYCLQTVMTPLHFTTTTEFYHVSVAPCRGYCGGSPTVVQAWQPFPLWEPSPSHPILLYTRGLAVFCVHVCLLYVWFVCVLFVPSVLWYCWLGLLTCKNCLPYNLYCVGGDVKNTAQSNPIRAGPGSWVHILAKWHERPLNQALVSFRLVCAYVTRIHAFHVVVGRSFVYSAGVLYQSRGWVSKMTCNALSGMSSHSFCYIQQVGRNFNLVGMCSKVT